VDIRPAPDSALATHVRNMFHRAMEANDPNELLPDDIIVPEGRDRLGLAHQMLVDISIAISLAPAWLRRALADRNPIKARGARVEMVERIAVALERRFLLTWCGSVDQDENARPPEAGGPLFGNPDQADPLVANLPVAGTESIDSGGNG
jgi:hypothetical protein